MSLNAKLRTFCLLQPLWILLALPVSAGITRIYVTNSAGDTVDVVDASTNKVVQVIKGIEVPHGVNFSPDGKWVYISNETDKVLDIVDQKSGAIVNKVSLSGHPNNIAVTKGGLVLVSIASAPGALDIVDPNGGEAGQDDPDERRSAQCLHNARPKICGCGIGSSEAHDGLRFANPGSGMGNGLRRRSPAHDH